MTDLQLMGKNAVRAKALLQKLNTEEKNAGLLTAADALISRTQEILDANAKDMENAVKNGMNSGL